MIDTTKENETKEKDPSSIGGRGGHSDRNTATTTANGSIIHIDMHHNSNTAINKINRGTRSYLMMLSILLVLLHRVSSSNLLPSSTSWSNKLSFPSASSSHQGYRCRRRGKWRRGILDDSIINEYECGNGNGNDNDNNPYENNKMNTEEAIITDRYNKMVSLEEIQMQQQHQNTYSALSVSNESQPLPQSQSLWPPWPFNLLVKPKSYNADQTHADTNSINSSSSIKNNSSGAQLLASYLRLKAQGGFEQLQQIGSALSFHLPPAAPPLLLLAILPTGQKQSLNMVESTAANAIANASSSTNSYMLPILAKRLGLTSLSIAVLSWADYEVRKKKRLTPLPLAPSKRNIRKALLPPFLPEQLPPLALDPLLQDSSSPSTLPLESPQSNELELTNALEDDANNDEEGFILDNLDGTDNVMRSIHKLYQNAPTPQRLGGHLQVLLHSWKKMNYLRQREEMEGKRRKIMEELLIRKEIKKYKLEKERFSVKKAKEMMIIAKGRFQGNSTSLSMWGSNTGVKSGAAGGGASAGTDSSVGSRSRQIYDSPPLGYALVTGASRGIGRAFAVELARWDIPLILVARDEEKLKEVASEIEMAYGVNCCVIPADLSQPDVANQIFEATENAGLKVDILVNNAGVCNTGDLIDGDEVDIGNMINVNIGSVTNLSYLYGKCMKRRRRGRILFVSSVVGAAPGGPGVAAYSATKAYEKSLAQSMGIELEKYGVGV